MACYEHVTEAPLWPKYSIQRKIMKILFNFLLLNFFFFCKMWTTACLWPKDSIQSKIMQIWIFFSRIFYWYMYLVFFKANTYALSEVIIFMSLITLWKLHKYLWNLVRSLFKIKYCIQSKILVMPIFIFRFSMIKWTKCFTDIKYIQLVDIW